MKINNTIKEIKIYLQHNNKNYCRIYIEQNNSKQIKWLYQGDPHKGEYGYFNEEEENQLLLEKYYNRLIREQKLERIVAARKGKK